jgi:hypothetical protein
MDSVGVFCPESCPGSGNAAGVASGLAMFSGRAGSEGAVTYSIGESFLSGLRETK